MSQLEPNANINKNTQQLQQDKNQNLTLRVKALLNNIKINFQ